ncbi:hypothetical protein GCM10007881_63460 [Mesorhizobium huakuii]|uniref:DUF4238 domain-containing protein n=1 Tax=Mesorhizobium huakuii TaxID=28104 RepID=UPI00235BB089|nr:DUF4238 domain-containing protein [Mesorhizobium huakuii]GLQ82823.1 hypothetical protein GCM10007881_63460 [Mesorhizobium huakuii]
MAQNKNQHYVPRCHLRPFTLNGEGACLNLYNVSSGKIIEEASASGQCSKDYFYGHDLDVEKAFQEIEGLYASTIRNIEARNGASEDAELFSLLNFAFLQRLRTDNAVRRVHQMQQMNEDIIFRGEERQAQRWKPMSRLELVQLTMVAYRDRRDVLDDLKTVVVRNETELEFVTSDDPSISTNRYYIQKLGATDFGLSNAGAIIALPISPRLLFLAYDGGCYTIPEKNGGVVRLKKAADVAHVNRFQILNCSANLYFSDMAMASKIAAQFREDEASRIAAWSVVEELIEVAENTFRRARTAEEARGAKRTIVHSSSRHPIPAGWPSFLKFRDPIRVVETGTGAGVVRRGVTRPNYAEGS